MSRVDQNILDRLGPQGLERALHDLLDQNHLARLAQSCGVRYPGMRTRSQKRERIVSDLAERAGRENAALRTILRVLRKTTQKASREWARLDPAERLKRLEDDSLADNNGKVGLHLFLLASGPPVEGSDEIVMRLVGQDEKKPSRSSPRQADSKESAKLQKAIARLEKKTKYLEGQLTRSRDSEKSLKRDLITRKGELAESRMLAERLKKQSEELRIAAAGDAPEATTKAFEKMNAAIRKLASEQRKLAHGIEKLTGRNPSLPPEALEPVLAVLERIEKEIGGLRRDRKRELQEQGSRTEEIVQGLKAARRAIEKQGSASRGAARRKGQPERVGVFVDVQNMYYGARQLKGKLDFDALLQAAVRDRRLIEATAYVVESKEIDQSGFIARLQQSGIEVRRKTLQVRADGSMKGDWDMEMALDILDAAPKLDVVVLVSGDGDFTSLVGRLKGMGPRVEVIGFPRNTAKSLVGAADGFHPLDRKFMIRTDATKKADA